MLDWTGLWILDWTQCVLSGLLITKVPRPGLEKMSGGRTCLSCLYQDLLCIVMTIAKLVHILGVWGGGGVGNRNDIVNHGNSLGGGRGQSLPLPTP